MSAPFRCGAQASTGIQRTVTRKNDNVQFISSPRIGADA
ncbi:hypothetical protein AXX16_3534 [Serratia rubidaea]|nr:hypothetical protein AXX16_3534 [Serratia rubidaea]